MSYLYLRQSLHLATLESLSAKNAVSSGFVAWIDGYGRYTAFPAGTFGTVDGYHVLDGQNGIQWADDSVFNRSLDGYQINLDYIPENYSTPDTNVIGAHIAAIDSKLKNIIAVSAGTNSVNSGIVAFSNSNGVSFGMNTGGVITGSVAGGAAISAGTNSANSGTVVFSNSNGVSFGMNTAGVITGSVAGGVAISAGTNSKNVGTVAFSNSNGVSFGMDTAGVVTGSVVGAIQNTFIYPSLNTSTIAITWNDADANPPNYTLVPFLVTQNCSISEYRENFSANITVNMSLWTTSLGRNGVHDFYDFVGLYSYNTSLSIWNSCLSASYPIYISKSTTSTNTNTISYSITAGINSITKSTSGFTGFYNQGQLNLAFTNTTEQQIALPFSTTMQSGLYGILRYFVATRASTLLGEAINVLWTKTVGTTTVGTQTILNAPHQVIQFKISSTQLTTVGANLSASYWGVGSSSSISSTRNTIPVFPVSLPNIGSVTSKCLTNIPYFTLQ